MWLLLRISCESRFVGESSLRMSSRPSDTRSLKCVSQILTMNCTIMISSTEECWWYVSDEMYSSSFRNTSTPKIGIDRMMSFTFSSVWISDGLKSRWYWYSDRFRRYVRKHSYAYSLWSCSSCTIIIRIFCIADNFKYE